MRLTQLVVVLSCTILITPTASASYLLEVDTDGLDDGVLTFHPGFSFGVNMTAVSLSIASTAVGMTGGDSIFGGTEVDPNDPAFDPNEPVLNTYNYAHDPGAQPDNLVLAPNTDLGEGNLASGRVGGGNGSYDVYATWPFTTGVSGGLTEYEVTTPGDSFTMLIDQNNRGHVWVFLGSINYTGGSIDVTQTAGANTFVSMRSAGILFERTVPEPASLALAALVGLGVICFARRPNA